ncbi:methylated-DNA--[protein]-cysteine S-methyltransferase [Sciscionella marina]|uniref:methylated-DNA--[protein]-cysteine S-methyltransferase n=1 Tax=Sciscionella marina TaxID=508770 RepID=UPI0003A69440|nr:methylated-DNA--[protein]-cysteine S-methyltransferase [Sciscionella marina]
MKRIPVMRGYLFPTAIGQCAITWSDTGVRSLRLPESSTERTLLLTGAEENEPQPPDWVRTATDRVARLLEGERDDLVDIPVDYTEVPEFAVAVYRATRAVVPGTTVSYGEIAGRVGEPGAAQAVGRALGNNPVTIIVPCHRVLASDGSMHGFSANGGVHTKRRMLTIEGALEPALFEL